MPEYSRDEAKLRDALRLIAATPGYDGVAKKLAVLAFRGRIRFHHSLEDRAHAGLLGTITLGPEALESGVLSLAQTLVHEHFHLRQNPFLKTVSFWGGVVSRTPVMRRYERPAYRAAFDFLETVKAAFPHLAEEARAEQTAIQQVFAACFGGELL